MTDRLAHQSDLSEVLCRHWVSLLLYVFAVYDFKRVNFLLLSLSFLIKNGYIDSYRHFMACWEFRLKIDRKTSPVLNTSCQRKQLEDCTLPLCLGRGEYLTCFCWKHENCVSLFILPSFCGPDVGIPFQTYMLKPSDQCDSVGGAAPLGLKVTRD